MREKQVEAVVGWGYALSGFTRIGSEKELPKPQQDFGYYWVTPDKARMETGDTLYLYRDGKAYAINLRTLRVEVIDTEEEALPFPLIEDEDYEGPWLGALLAMKVGRLTKRVSRDRLGALVCQRVEWSNPSFVERRWHYRLGSGLVLVRTEVLYKDKQEGFVMLAGLVEGRVERVPHSLFELPSL